MKKKELWLSILALGAAFSIAGCTAVPQGGETMSQSMQTEAMQGTDASMAVSTQSNEAAMMEETPQSNFYKYINEEWLKETKIPEGESVVNNFSQLQLKTDSNIRDMIAKLQNDYDSLAEGSPQKKLVDLYNMAADFETRNRMKMEPIREYVEEIRNVSDMGGFRATSVKLFSRGVVSSFSYLIDKDVKNSSVNALYLDKPELGLSKKNFEGNDEHAIKQQEAFLKYLQEIFVWSGHKEEDAMQMAKEVYQLEKEMAKGMLPAEQASDQELLYNPRTWEELKEFAPSVPVFEAAQAIQLGSAAQVILSEPKALEAVNPLYTQENLKVLKAYMEYRLIHTNRHRLSKDLVEIAARFEAASTGAYSVPKDEELAYDLVSQNFQDLVSKLYTDNFFMPTAKADVIDMVNDVKSTYIDRIQNLDWMTEETKKQALKKLDTMSIKIAYPDKWVDYSDVEILSAKDGGNIVRNLEAILHKSQTLDRIKFENEPDRTGWSLPPHTVNAYYNPLGNEIVFPAAILQPPFYDPNASREENLGGIGAVIGHEVTHAFDNQGGKFDENGNLHNWWSEEDLEKFQKKVDQAAEIYSKLEVAPGYHVNGKISTGEIIADLGGMTVAISIAEKKGYDTKKVFESYAKVWREVNTKEYAISNIEDVHPPGMYRVNNIINQIDRFYEDYNIKEGDAMYVPPSERLRVW